MLCVDEAGLPVAVEVKLSRNGESRRAIVAQIVDYLSSLTSLTVDEVDSEVDGALEQALKSFDAIDDDAPDGFEPRWQAFGANLRSGSARIIVALDHAPADLKRIVQFLSDRSRLDIRLITVSKFVDARVGALYVSTVLVGQDGQPVAPSPETPPVRHAWLREVAH